MPARSLAGTLAGQILRTEDRTDGTGRNPCKVVGRAGKRGSTRDLALAGYLPCWVGARCSLGTGQMPGRLMFHENGESALDMGWNCAKIESS